FGIAIDNSPCVESKRPAITRASELSNSDDRFITGRCPALNASEDLFRRKPRRRQYPFRHYGNSSANRHLIAITVALFTRKRAEKPNIVGPSTRLLMLLKSSRSKILLPPIAP